MFLYFSIACAYFCPFVALSNTNYTAKTHPLPHEAGKKETSGECLEHFHPLGTYIPFH